MQDATTIYSMPKVGRELIPQALNAKHIPSHCTIIIQISSILNAPMSRIPNNALCPISHTTKSKLRKSHPQYPNAQSPDRRTIPDK